MTLVKSSGSASGVGNVQWQDPYGHEKTNRHRKRHSGTQAVSHLNPRTGHHLTKDPCCIGFIICVCACV